MKHPVRVFVLACALALTPACASIRDAFAPVANPVAAAQSLDQRAYALLHTYAAVIEEATDIVRDPAAPLAFKRVLGEAERVATPAAEALEIAIASYLRARADFDAAASADASELQRATLALSVAARRLAEAIAAADAPIGELADLVRAHRS